MKPCGLCIRFLRVSIGNNAVSTDVPANPPAINAVVKLVVVYIMD